MMLRWISVVPPAAHSTRQQGAMLLATLFVRYRGRILRIIPPTPPSFGLAAGLSAVQPKRPIIPSVRQTKLEAIGPA